VVKRKRSGRKSVSELIDERTAEMFSGRPQNGRTYSWPDRNGILIPKWTLVDEGNGLPPKAGAFRLKGEHLKKKATNAPGECVQAITYADFSVGNEPPIFHPANRMVRMKLTKASDPNLRSGKRK